MWTIVCIAQAFQLWYLVTVYCEVGPPHGGVGVLWKHYLAGSVEVMYYDDVRLIGLQIVNGNETLLILCVGPVCTADNLDDFVMYLGKIHAIVLASETANVIVIGDFNAAIDFRFGWQLSGFCDEYFYIRSDLEFLGHNSDVYTFVSEAHDTVSWLDHCIICTTGAQNSILSVSIGNESPITDHLPLIVVMSYNSVIATVQSTNCNTRNNCVNNNQRKGVKWERQSNKCIHNYTAMTMKMISEIERHNEAELYTNIKCVDMAHIVTR